MKKLLKNYLKVTATLIFWFVVTNTVEAESPLSFTQIPGTANALISDIMFDGNIIRVTGNYSKVNINGTDFAVDKYSEINNNTWTIPTLTSPVRDGKFYKIDGVTYLVGNNAGNGSIYKLQAGNWVLVKTISGKILTSTSFSSTIVIGGEFSGYIGFFQTKNNTFTTSMIPVKPVVQLVSTTTRTMYRYAEADQFGNELGGIIDNVTMQRSSVSLPNMIFLRGIGANIENEYLYVSGQTNTSDVTYVFDGNWSLFATHSNQDYFNKFWFNDGKVYASCGTSVVNGTQMYGLAVFSSGQWSSVMSSNENYPPVDILFNNGFIYINTGLSFVVARVSTPTGVKNNIAKSDIKLYPNPTTDKIVITSPEAREVPLLTLSGQTINVYQIAKDQPTTIDVSDLANGSYYFGTTQFVVSK